MRARKNRAVPSVPRCAAVIVAAGVSRRMGGRKRKPYLELRGKPILAWTAARLAKLDGVEQLVVVTRSEDRGQARRAIRQARLPRRIGVTYVEGGARRQDSVLNGIRAASPETEIVLIHDAARPFPPLEAMRAAVDAARRQGGAILAVPVRDTIKRQQEGDREAIVGATVPRAGLWQAQTPQVFRRALIPPDQAAERSSNWATTQVYLAHFALADVKGRRFQYFERFQRGAGGLAGAQGEPGFRVWLDDWRVEQTAERKYHLAAGEGDLRLELDLADVKGPVFQGDRGYSQKGDEPGNASYYVSLTRLVSQGTVEVGGVRYAVSGLSWMDHEFSTSALSQGQVGWDWFSIQLQDGSELMMYTIRREDGGVDPYSSGTVILPDGSTRRLGANDFTIRAEDSWESPHSGGVYPSAWVIEVPSEGLVLRVRPRLADQELNVSFIYWEGAVRVEGEKEGVRIEGSGYVELTGYAQSLENTF